MASRCMKHNMDIKDLSEIERRSVEAHDLRDLPTIINIEGPNAEELCIRLRELLAEHQILYSWVRFRPLQIKTAFPTLWTKQ